MNRILSFLISTNVGSIKLFLCNPKIIFHMNELLVVTTCQLSACQRGWWTTRISPFWGARFHVWRPWPGDPVRQYQATRSRHWTHTRTKNQQCNKMLSKKKQKKPCEPGFLHLVFGSGSSFKKVLSFFPALFLIS